MGWAILGDILCPAADQSGQPLTCLFDGDTTMIMDEVIPCHVTDLLAIYFCSTAKIAQMKLQVFTSNSTSIVFGCF